MAITETPNLGLQKQDKGDLNWHLAINTSFDRLETRLTKSYAGDPNGNVAGDFVGQLCADTTNGGVWVCTTTGSAATAVWKRLTTTGGLTVSGDLSVTGSSTFTGSVAANGGLVVPTGQTLRGPASQAWITNGSDSLDPIAHAARHRASGADPVPYLIYGVQSASGSATVQVNGGDTYTAGGNPLVSLTWDTSGRTTTSSALCIFQLTEPLNLSLGTVITRHFGLHLDGSLTGREVKSEITLVNEGSITLERPLTAAWHLSGVAAGSHTVEVRARNTLSGGSQDTLKSPHLILIDLGIE